MRDRSERRASEATFALARSRFYWKLQRFPLRLSFQFSPHAAPATKSDTWTSPNAAPATKSDTWSSPNAAPATKSDTWSSPNTAPATQKECHDWSASHMKRHLQCAEQQASISNLTKYCAYHAKLHSQILEKLTENSWSGISNARPIRAWSDHDPTMIRPRKRKPQPAAPQRLLFALARSRFY